MKMSSTVPPPGGRGCCTGTAPPESDSSRSSRRTGRTAPRPAADDRLPHVTEIEDARGVATARCSSMCPCTGPACPSRRTGSSARPGAHALRRAAYVSLYSCSLPFPSPPAWRRYAPPRPGAPYPAHRARAAGAGQDEDEGRGEELPTEARRITEDTKEGKEGKE